MSPVGSRIRGEPVIPNLRGAPSRAGDGAQTLAPGPGSCPDRPRILGCLAEPVVGPRLARTRRLAMTVAVTA